MYACRLCGLQRGGADHRDIKPKVLIRFGYLDHGGLAAAKFPAALDGRIGALKAFHGEDGALFDNHGLSDVQPAHLLGDPEAELEILQEASAGVRACEMPGGSEVLLHEGGGGQEWDSDAGALRCDGSKNTFGVALLEFGEDEQRLHVGPKVEEVFWGDLTGHDGGGGTRVLEVLEQRAELSDTEGRGVIDEGAEFGLGFVEESGCDEAFDTCLSGFLRKDQRIRTVTGDDGEAFRDEHEVGGGGDPRFRTGCPSR